MKGKITLLYIVFSIIVFIILLRSDIRNLTTFMLFIMIILATISFWDQNRKRWGVSNEINRVIYIVDYLCSMVDLYESFCRVSIKGFNNRDYLSDISYYFFYISRFKKSEETIISRIHSEVQCILLILDLIISRTVKKVVNKILSKRIIDIYLSVKIWFSRAHITIMSLLEHILNNHRVIRNIALISNSLIRLWKQV